MEIVKKMDGWKDEDCKKDGWMERKIVKRWMDGKIKIVKKMDG